MDVRGYATHFPFSLIRYGRDAFELEVTADRVV